MHELSLATSLLELLDRECQRINRHDLKEVEIEIGDFSGVEKETFRFCLETIKIDTCYNDVAFNFIEITSECRCINCGKCFFPEHRIMECKYCGSSMVGLIHGKEFKVKSLIF